jgi:hypothetical protein
MTKAADLVLKLYASAPLCSSAVLDAIDGVLWAHLQEWRSGLRLLAEYEDEGAGIAVEERKLAETLPAVAPMRFGLCAANMAGAYTGVAAFVQCSRNSLPPELNMLTIEVTDLLRVEGRVVADWARSFFCAVVAAVPLRYGQARTRAEFDAKNMIRENRSVKAVGVNLKRSLPGLYWFNFLGPDYVDLMGRESIASAPAPIVEELGGGFCIGLGDDPGSWSTREYQQRESAVLAHVGESFFFSKADPGRLTRAPAFGGART